MTAWINKPKKKTSYKKHNKHIDIAKIYNTTQWRDLRAAYIAAHPLCEMCLKNGIVRQAEEVHHILPISTGLNELEMQTIAYNPDNLMSLCCECHHKIHQQMRKNH